MGNVYKVLGKQKKIDNSTTCYPDRLVIELCENIHIHYRNLRMEFEEKEFLQFSDSLREAGVDYRLNKWRKTQQIIPLRYINPYDDGHLEVPDDEHRRGIDFIKPIIKSGAKIMPILVKPTSDNTYQRLDGYKRYMSYKELGHESIMCYVDENGLCGEQTGMGIIEL